MADSMSVEPVSQLDDILDTCNSLQITVEGETVHPIKAGTMLDDDQNPTYCGFVLSDEIMDVLDTIIYTVHILNSGHTKVPYDGHVMFGAKNADLIAHLTRLQRGRLDVRTVGTGSTAIQ